MLRIHWDRYRWTLLSISIPMTSAPGPSAVNGSNNDRSVAYIPRAVESPAKRAVKCAPAGQPSPTVKPVVPVPARTSVKPAITVSIPIPPGAVAVSRDILRHLIAGGRVIFGAHVAPGVKVVFSLGVELCGFQVVGNHRFAAFAELNLSISEVNVGLAFEHRRSGRVIAANSIQTVLLQHYGTAVIDDLDVIILHQSGNLDHRFTAFHFYLDIGQRG